MVYATGEKEGLKKVLWDGFADGAMWGGVTGARVAVRQAAQGAGLISTTLNLDELINDIEGELTTIYHSND